MRLRLTVRALIQLWDWAMPGLMSLEPIGMAYFEASREIAPGPIRVVAGRLTEREARIGVRAEAYPR